MIMLPHIHQTDIGRVAHTKACGIFHRHLYESLIRGSISALLLGILSRAGTKQGYNSQNPSYISHKRNNNYHQYLCHAIHTHSLCHIFSCQQAFIFSDVGFVEKLSEVVVCPPKRQFRIPAKAASG